MKKRLKHISPLQFGIVLCAFYGAISLILVPLFFLVAAFGPHRAGLGSVFVILIPIFYAAMGFVFGIIAAAIYNLIAGWTGGIEFTFEDVPPAL